MGTRLFIDFRFFNKSLKLLEQFAERRMYVAIISIFRNFSSLFLNDHCPVFQNPIFVVFLRFCSPLIISDHISVCSPLSTISMITHILAYRHREAFIPKFPNNIYWFNSFWKDVNFPCPTNPFKTAQVTFIENRNVWSISVTSIFCWEPKQYVYFNKKKYNMYYFNKLIRIYLYNKLEDNTVM